MPFYSLRSLSLVACITAIAPGLSGCSDKQSLPSDTVYRAVDGTPAIKIVSSKELELTNGGDRLVCEYSREGDRLRVVVAVFGTKQAVYFSIVPDGLREENGTVLYRPARYEQVMREINAARRQQALNGQLLEAAQKGESARVASLLSQGASVAASDSEGFSALHMAVEAGSQETVKHLLNAKAQPNAKNNHGVAPLHSAANIGGRHLGFGDLGSGFRRERNPDDDAILALLIKSGADVNATTTDGKTPLMIAVIRRNAGAIRQLVTSGANRELKAGGKTAHDMAEGDADTLAAMRTPDEDAASTRTLKTVLQSGHPFFGQEQSGRGFAFQIAFDAFNDASGRFTGTMNYYPPDDGAILAFEGSLEGAVLKLSHTGTLKKGQSTPDWCYTLRLTDQETLAGYYARKGSTDAKGGVRIDLNETRRQEMERRVKLAEGSRTATKVIKRVVNRAMFARGGEVALTDVSIKGDLGGEEEIFFSRISKVGQNQGIITITGPSSRGFGEFMRTIKPANKQECDDFYQAFLKAYDAWKTKYGELLRASDK